MARTWLGCILGGARSCEHKAWKLEELEDVGSVEVLLLHD